MGTKKKVELPSCDICCETLNKSNRKPVQCPYCEKDACMQCTKMYVSTSIKDPHCMHCKVAWNMTFVKKVFPTAWLNKEYKEIREKILFDLELSKIPDTQRFCDAWKARTQLMEEKEKTAEKLQELKADAHKLEKEYEECNQDIWMLTEGGLEQNKLELLKDTSHGLYLQIKAKTATVEETEELLDDLVTRIRSLTRDITGGEPHDVPKETEMFHVACPKTDCKGFVDKKWMCGLCKSRVCAECHEVKEDMEIHRCDPSNKASVEMLKSDSKTCPKCSALIHKISGCDQMWCTRCRTAFSWKTGVIEETIHNPHYFEWVRLRAEGENNENGDMEDCG